MKVIALKSFADGEAGSVHQGQVLDMPSGADWVRVGLAEEVSESKDVSDYYTGGGWYTLPDGTKVQGEDKARELL